MVTAKQFLDLWESERERLEGELGEEVTTSDLQGLVDVAVFRQLGVYDVEVMKADPIGWHKWLTSERGAR
jgi:hypothetical protein